MGNMDGPFNPISNPKIVLRILVHVNTRLAAFLLLLGVTSITNVLPVAINAKLKNTPCNIHKPTAIHC